MGFDSIRHRPKDADVTDSRLPRLDAATTPHDGGRMRTFAAILVAACCTLTACDWFDAPPGGSLGEEGVVYFQPEIDAVTTVPLMVGSVFTMKAVANDAEDDAKVASGFFVSLDSNVIEIIEGGTLGGQLRVSGPGTVTLEVHSEAGDRLDAISLRAEIASSIEFLDAKIVGASVDARLPARFAVVEDHPAPLFIAVESACAEALLAVGGIEATWEDGTVATLTRSETAGDLTYTLEPLALGSSGLTLAVESGAKIDYEIDVVEEDGVYEVRNVPAASESPTVEFWGRAFADGVEIIGLDYDWTSPNGRVNLSRTSGSNVIAQVSFPAEGEPEDTRPAEIKAEAFGESQTIDIFRLQTTDLVGERVPPKENNDSTSSGGGCTQDNSGTCALLVGGGLLFWRRRKRRHAGA